MLVVSSFTLHLCVCRARTVRARGDSSRLKLSVCLRAGLLKSLLKARNKQQTYLFVIFYKIENIESRSERERETLVPDPGHFAEHKLWAAATVAAAQLQNF